MIPRRRAAFFHTAVMGAAITELDSADHDCACESDSFPLPVTWIAGHDPANATRLDHDGISNTSVPIRRGSARVWVARPPSGPRADWASIIADANAGITADFNIAVIRDRLGRGLADPSLCHRAPRNWHQMSQF